MFWIDPHAFPAPRAPAEIVAHPSTGTAVSNAERFYTLTQTLNRSQRGQREHQLSLPKISEERRYLKESARSSRAFCQSRRTVRSVTPMAQATSLSVMPAK
jgi:hypothetical protein